DGVVLTGLAARVVLAAAPRTRELFARIGLFFLLYSVADGVYLYAEAAWQNNTGTWLDILWSIPRVAMIVTAATWNEGEEKIDKLYPIRGPARLLPLHTAPVVGPLLVLLVTSSFSGVLPGTAATLVAIAFGCSSVRLLITQYQQTQASAELRRSRD